MDRLSLDLDSSSDFGSDGDDEEENDYKIESLKDLCRIGKSTQTTWHRRLNQSTSSHDQSKMKIEENNQCHRTAVIATMVQQQQEMHEYNRSQ